MACVDLGDGSDLHLAHWPGDDGAAPVLMLHGAVANGRIFYSRSGRGLAPYLAARGLDVYVVDLRGRGGSRPAIARASRHGQYESIVEELPAAAAHVAAASGDRPQHWVAHSWGGVLMAATLARLPEWRPHVASLTFFGAKRSVRVHTRDRWLYIDGVWFGVAPLLTALMGYLPARALRLGADNETRRSHGESAAWVRPRPWRDPRDGFDYAAALAGSALPPLLALAGAGDRALGHPADVADFVAECGRGTKRVELLARANGYARDYGHVDMLTARQAVDDHFPVVADWIARHDGGA